MIAFRLLLFICFAVDWPAFSCWASPFYFFVVVVGFFSTLLFFLACLDLWLCECVCVCSFLSLYLRDLLSTHDNGQYGVCAEWTVNVYARTASTNYDVCEYEYSILKIECAPFESIRIRNAQRKKRRSVRNRRKKKRNQPTTTNPKSKSKKAAATTHHRSFACLLRTLFPPSPSFERLKAFIYLFRVIYLHSTLRCQPTCVSV